MTAEPIGRLTFESDTIVVPAHPKGFNDVYLGQHQWTNLKLDKRRIEKLRYVAVYQTAPVSAITHYAEIGSYEPLERKGRYNVHFSGEPIEIDPVQFKERDPWAIQGPRYTELRLILKASSLVEAFPSLV